VGVRGAFAGLISALCCWRRSDGVRRSGWVGRGAGGRRFEVLERRGGGLGAVWVGGRVGLAASVVLGLEPVFV
jgi:hypothetical protein